MAWMSAWIFAAGWSVGAAWGADRGALEEPLWLEGEWARGPLPGCVPEEPTIPGVEAGSCAGPGLSEAAGRRIVWRMAVEAREVLEVCAVAACPAGMVAMMPALEGLAGDPGLWLEGGVYRSASGASARLDCGEGGCALTVEGAGRLWYGAEGTALVVRAGGASLSYWESGAAWRLER